LQEGVVVANLTEAVVVAVQEDIEPQLVYLFLYKVILLPSVLVDQHLKHQMRQEVVVPIQFFHQ
jgi:hypothetical protein